MSLTRRFRSEIGSGILSGALFGASAGRSLGSSVIIAAIKSAVVEWLRQNGGGSKCRDIARIVAAAAKGALGKQVANLSNATGNVMKTIISTIVSGIVGTANTTVGRLGRGN